MKVKCCFELPQLALLLVTDHGPAQHSTAQVGHKEAQHSAAQLSSAQLSSAQLSSAQLRLGTQKHSTAQHSLRAAEQEISSSSLSLSLCCTGWTKLRTLLQGQIGLSSTHLSPGSGGKSSCCTAGMTCLLGDPVS